VNIQPERPDLGFNIVLTDLVIGLDDLGRPLWLELCPKVDGVDAAT
jgi:hypothetical protein